MRLPPPQSTKSRALGALLGMAVGDALGAPLGGQDGVISSSVSSNGQMISISGAE